MIRIGIAGARGRMGMMNIESVIADEDMALGAALERIGHPDVGRNMNTYFGANADVVLTDDMDAFLDACDVVIDFTFPEASLALLEKARNKPVGFVLGSTGFTPEQNTRLSALSEEVAMVFSPNMSVGVNALFAIVKRAAELLHGFDVEIIETHHHNKKDAPSGTALHLGIVVANEFNIDFDKSMRSGREGIVGARPKNEIGMHAVRAGDIVGEHTVLFCRDGERIEISHKAHSRKNFSLGAVTAAKWIMRKPAGMYSMNDVLGL